MAMPTGKIIARPMVARACGHMCEFQQYAVDKYYAQRLAKFQKTRCAECVAKLNAEQQRAAAALLKKGEAIQLLPAGTQLAMKKLPDGTWSGTLVADGKSVDAMADGLLGLASALARVWASAHAAPPKES